MKNLYLILTCLFISLQAEDWPTFKNNNHRSGVTAATLGTLKPLWQWKSTTLPQTAWSGPAKWDAWAGNDGLQSLRNFDPAFFVTGQNNEVYFGSSVDNAVHCLDKTTGKEKWVFFTEGPVRFPPTIADNQLVFGSDDGCVYSIDFNGKLNWKYEVVPQGRKVASNGKIISMWPVRTGVLYHENKLYFAASLVPWEKSYVCSLNAKTGQKIFKTHHTNITLEGAILAAAGKLIIPQGRASALTFSLQNGQGTGDLGNAGSTFILATEDNKLVTGPKNQKGSEKVIISDAESRTNMVQLDGTDHMIIDGPYAYYHKNSQLHCINRHDYAKHGMEKSKLIKEKNATAKKLKNQKDELKKKMAELDAKIKQTNTYLENTKVWQVDAELPISFIKAGNKLICGLDGKVTVHDIKSGKLLQILNAPGRAYGLAAWDGNLIISSDEGHISCFGK